MFDEIWLNFEFEALQKCILVNLVQGVPMPPVQSSCLENPRARFCEWLGKRTRVTVAKCKVGEFRDRQPVWSHIRQVQSAKC